MELTDNEKSIIRCLQQSEFYEVNYKQLGQALNLDQQVVKDTIRKLQDTNIVTGFFASIDSEKLGYITAFIRCKLNWKSTEVIPNLLTFSEKGPKYDFRIQEIFIITGDDDLQLKVKVKGLDGYKQFVKLFEEEVISFGYGSGSIGIEKIKEEALL